MEAELSQRIQNQLFGPKKEGDIPHILCRRNEPVEFTYDIHDTSLEGLRPVYRRGKIEHEVYHDFVLIIPPDGYCLIPDSPNNRQRLERISVPVKRIVKHQKLNFTTNEMESTDVEEIEKPQYEIVEQKTLDQKSSAKIASEILSSLNEEQLVSILDGIRQKRAPTTAIVEAPETAPKVTPDSNTNPIPVRRRITSEAPETTPPAPAGAQQPGVVHGTKRVGRPRSQTAVPAA